MTLDELRADVEVKQRAFYDAKAALRRAESDADPRCRYTFPLPSWMGADQADPCRCDLPKDHDDEHLCSHIRAERRGGTDR